MFSGTIQVSAHPSLAYMNHASSHKVQEMQIHNGIKDQICNL
jgi:hypothetical protein